MRVRITNEATAAGESVAVAIYRPDMPAGEPGSLMREHTLRAGESAVFDLPPLASVIASEQP